ncbi:hypothetical protein HAX54_035934 [Datura stramonium]|uniref:Uncharacterized protein n=1 Tax=Datura stramonium TaxID=4076 RepID=A0ABS8VJY0_DATST|nr:hypothetical protein [Datura stramonium]
MGNSRGTNGGCKHEKTTTKALWDPLGHGERRRWYDLTGLDVPKTKEPKGIHDPVLSISECNVRIDNVLRHLYDMQMLLLRMSRVIEERLQYLSMDYPLSKRSRYLYKVGLGFEEPFDDDDSNE